MVPLFVDRDSQTPIDYIHIPNLPRCDGAIYVVGDSMYPLLKSGDIVLYKQVSGIENIFGAICICCRSILTARSM